MGDIGNASCLGHEQNTIAPRMFAELFLHITQWLQ